MRTIWDDGTIWEFTVRSYIETGVNKIVTTCLINPDFNKADFNIIRCELDQINLRVEVVGMNVLMLGVC